MSKRGKLLLVVAALLIVGLAYAQRPPEVTEQGEAYLRVNINPTDIPPMVNINPYNLVPKVEVTRMPDIQFKPAPSGCSDRSTFVTGIARSVPGPLMLTYLSIPQPARMTLASPGGSQSISVNSPAQISTLIFLQPGQRLDFDNTVFFSGCQPIG
jgi:hypothetical protein